MTFLENAYETLRQGGWPMIPIGICSVVALTIILERLFVLRRGRIIEENIRRVIENYSGEESADTASRVCASARSPFARIVEEVLRNRYLDHTRAFTALETAGRTQVGRLERGLTVLEIVAGISPLLGLLGTTLGMVTVFDAIASEGVGNPQVLSDGISKALITTVAGLCVAIPSLAFHSFLSRRVEDLATEMHDRAVNFATRLHAMSPSES